MISSFTSPQNIILVSPGKFAHSSSFEFEELAIATGGAVSKHFIFEQKLITPSHFISKGKLSFPWPINTEDGSNAEKDNLLFEIGYGL